MNKAVARALLAVTTVALLLTAPTSITAQTASVNQLLLTLRQQDLSGVPILNRQIGYLSYAGTVGNFTNAILSDTNSHSQTLPATNVINVYFRNTHATANITLTFTTPAGSNAVKISPGAAFVLWGVATGGGISTLSLQSDTSNATYEMFLGA